jgi:hypothetical protein
MTVEEQVAIQLGGDAVGLPAFRIVGLSFDP